MAPTYKLVYYNLRGIAEPIRFMFEYKGVPYEDYRISDEDWRPKGYKQKQPFGLIPVLEVDGHIISSSLGIMRYLAREFGLDGKDKIESAMADMAMESIQDCVDKLRTFARKTKDEEKKEQLGKVWLNEIAPDCLEGINKMLKNNGGKYFAGDSLTWADFGIATFVEIVEQFIPEIRQKYPLLTAHLDNFNSIPAIKAWIEKRPKTPL